MPKVKLGEIQTVTHEEALRLFEILEVQKKREPIVARKGEHSTFGQWKTPQDPDKVVGLKTFDATQVAIVEDIRRKRGNLLAQSSPVQFGVKWTSLSEERKQRAVDAFTYTQPASLNEEQKKALVQIKEVTPAPTIVQTVIKPTKVNRWVLGLYGVLFAILIGTILSFPYCAKPTEKLIYYNNQTGEVKP